MAGTRLALNRLWTHITEESPMYIGLGGLLILILVLWLLGVI